MIDRQANHTTFVPVDGSLEGQSPNLQHQGAAGMRPTVKLNNLCDSEKIVSSRLASIGRFAPPHEMDRTTVESLLEMYTGKPRWRNGRRFQRLAFAATDEEYKGRHGYCLAHALLDVISRHSVPAFCIK